MRFNLLLLVYLFCLCSIKIVVSNENDNEEEEEKEENHHGNNTSVTDPIFPPIGYESRESGIHGAPQRIKVTVWVEAIVNIDVSAMEYVMHGYVIQEWHDARLKGVLSHPILLSRSSASSVWLPDIYCLSCRSSTLNSLIHTNVLIKVYPNGNIYYSQLAKLHSSCYMELHSFPFDKQVCPLNLSSYGYNAKYLIYSWKSTPVVEKMQLEQFTVNEKVIATSSWKSYPAGNFTILSFELFFTRQTGFYILQVYLPCAILVSLSWMTFYMEAADIGDRLSIGVTLILTMIFLLGYINQSLPKVSYIKAVDWYVIASLFMIVTSVLESVFVYWLLHRKKREEKKEDSFARFDRYIDKKLSLSNITMNNIVPLINPSGLSMPNLPTVGPKPFRQTHSVSDIQNTIPEHNGHDTTADETQESSKLMMDKACAGFKKARRRGLAKRFQNGDEAVVEERADSESSEDIKLSNMNTIFRVDIVARIIFPCSFIIFNIAYVCYYTMD